VTAPSARLLLWPGAVSTPPRRILPAKSYLVTRRCSERRFFLRPSSIVNEVFLYVLAVAARRHRVLVHAFCVLSNHVHLVVTDQDGRLPAFMQYLDSLVARAINASLGRFEAFWASGGSYSAVEPIDPCDVVAKAAYVLANPVAAGLVQRGADWPGLWSSPEQISSGKRLAHRPKHFFASDGYMPKEVGLELSPPPGFTSSEFRAGISEALGRLEEQHRRQLASEGRCFLGVARVLAQSPFARPRAGEPRFEVNPRIAARDKWRRIEAIQRLKTFIAEYRQAWDARRKGEANVLFPAGTYSLRLLHGVQCAGAA
jgi:REP element-mobilizing transposase RayT